MGGWGSPRSRVSASDRLIVSTSTLIQFGKYLSRGWISVCPRGRAGAWPWSSVWQSSFTPQDREAGIPICKVGKLSLWEVKFFTHGPRTGTGLARDRPSAVGPAWHLGAESQGLRPSALNGRKSAR